MQGSKIRLSAAEASLFCNAEVILTKNSILQKTVALLAQVQEELATKELQQNFSSTPKISKGENYLGLPYVVLDYPRIAKGDDLFFIRSLFWWGNFFSSTLHVSGQYKENNLLNIAAAYNDLVSQHFFIGINNDPWQHHFEPSNYANIADLPKEKFFNLLQQQPYIKIAARWSLSQWDAAANLLVENWLFLVSLIA